MSSLLHFYYSNPNRKPYRFDYSSPGSQFASVSPGYSSSSTSWLRSSSAWTEEGRSSFELLFSGIFPDEVLHMIRDYCASSTKSREELAEEALEIVSIETSRQQSELQYLSKERKSPKLLAPISDSPLPGIIRPNSRLDTFDWN